MSSDGVERSQKNEAHLQLAYLIWFLSLWISVAHCFVCTRRADGDKLQRPLYSKTSGHPRIRVNISVCWNQKTLQTSCFPEKADNLKTWYLWARLSTTRGHWNIDPPGNGGYAGHHAATKGGVGFFSGEFVKEFCRFPLWRDTRSISWLKTIRNNNMVQSHHIVSHLV